MSHILLIEDDEQFRQMMIQMLKSDGHQVSAASDGIEAIAMLERIKPDLIITDMLMPNMDGVGIVIHLSKSGNKTPVIAISGGRRSISVEFNLESAAVLGVKATLPKPFTRNDLRETIRNALI